MRPPERGVLFDFLPPVFFAVTVSSSSAAEEHFELLFSAGNSDTVYIRPSKVPYISLILF